LDSPRQPLDNRRCDFARVVLFAPGKVDPGEFGLQPEKFEQIAAACLVLSGKPIEPGIEKLFVLRQDPVGQRRSLFLPLFRLHRSMYDGKSFAAS